MDEAQVSEAEFALQFTAAVAAKKQSISM